MTEEFLEEYFTAVATKTKDIAHTPESLAFHRIQSRVDLDEFDNAVRNMTKSTCLLLEMGSGTIGEYDSAKDGMRIGLHVLNKTSGSFAEIRAARNNAKTTLLKIVALMKHDCKPVYLYSNNSAGPLHAAKIQFDGAVKYDDMEAIGGDWYGKTIYFDFRAPISLVYDPTDFL